MYTLLKKNVALLGKTELFKTDTNWMSGEAYLKKYFVEEEIALYKKNPDLYIQQYGTERANYLKTAIFIKAYFDEGMTDSKIVDREPPPAQPIHQKPPSGFIL
jgi:hypothetical protein